MYCKVVFLFCLFIMQPWFYPVVKYCFNAICFTRFIFVNSVIVSLIISCNDLYQDFIIMYVWYFVSRNSISVLGAIWPSLSPCTVINPMLLTYLPPHRLNCWENDPSGNLFSQYQYILTPSQNWVGWFLVNEDSNGTQNISKETHIFLYWAWN